jgi:hypothetical protein
MAKKITPTFSSGGFPVVPQSTTGIDVGFEGSKYERPIAPGESVEQVLAAEQGMMDVTGNILGRFLGRATLSVAETAGMIGYGSIAAIRDRSFSSLYDNELSKQFKKADEFLVKNTPFYDTAEEKKAKFFSSDIFTVMGSAGFWGNALGEGAGFVAGAVAGGYGTGLLLKGLGALGRGALTVTRMSKAVTAATEAEQLGALAAEGVKDVNFANKVKNVLSSAKFKNAAQFQTQRAVSNMYEAGVEAKGIKEEYIANMEKDFKLQYGEDAVADEATKLDWEKQANKYANVGFGINMALLNLDGIGYSRYFKGYKETRKAIDATRDAATGMYKPLTGIRKGISTVKNYGGNAFAESFQEAGQYVTEKTLTDRDLQQSGRGITDYVRATIKGLEETFGSKEGQESMVIGAMLGGPSSVREGMAQGKLNQVGIDLLNKYMAKESIAPIIKHTNDAVQSNKGDLSERVAESSSKYLFRSAQDEAFYNYVNSRIQSGRFGDMMDDLDDFKRMDEGTFNELFVTSYDRVKKDQTVQELINSAKRIQDITDKTDAVYGKNKFKSEIIKTVADVSTYDKRINEIQSKLASENNPLERELLMSDLGFLVKDRDAANAKLRLMTSLASNEEIALNKEKNEKPKKEIEKIDKEKPPVAATPTPSTDIVKGNTVVVDGKKVIIEGINDDGTVRGATPAGPITFDPDEIDAPIQGFEKSDHYDEEPQELTPEKATLGRDAVDAPAGENFGGRAFVYDPLDPNSEFGQWTDFQPILNNDVLNNKLNNGNATELDKTNGAKAQEVVDKLINDNMKKIKDTHTFEVRNENGRNNLYAIDRKDNKPTLIGFFKNGNFQVGNSSNTKSKKKHNGLNEFVDSYSQTEQGKRKQIPDKNGRNVFMDVINGWRKLINSKVADVTNYLKLRSEILNTGTPTTLAEIMNSPYAERWKVNGEYVIVHNDNGNYILIDNVNQKSNIDLANEYLNKPDAVRSLGTQYAILVKRPDSDNYQFIGLKGGDLSATEKQSYVELVKKVNNNPGEYTQEEVDKIINDLNKNIFLATNKVIKIEGQEVPIHIRFYRTKGKNQIKIITSPKLGLDGKPVGGIKLTLKQAFGTFPDVESAIINLGKKKIYKASEEAQDLDFLKDYLETKVSPTIWKTYFRFEHRDFLANEVNNTNEKYSAAEQEFPANSENVYNVGDSVIWNGAPHTIAKIVAGGVPFYTLADASGNIVKTSTKQDRLFPATQLTPAKKEAPTERMKNVGMSRQQAEDDIEKLGVDLYYAKLLGKSVEKNKPLDKGKQYLRIIVDMSNHASAAEIITGTGEVYNYTQMSGYSGSGTSNQMVIQLPSFYDSKGKLFEGSLSTGYIYEIPNIDINNKELLAQFLSSSNYIKNKPISAKVGFVNNNDGTSTLKYYDLNFNVKQKIIETPAGAYPEKLINDFLKKEYDAELAALKGVKPTAPVSDFNSLPDLQKQNLIAAKILKAPPTDMLMTLTPEERKYYNEYKTVIDNIIDMLSIGGLYQQSGKNNDLDPALGGVDIADNLPAEGPIGTFKPAIEDANLEEISDEVAREIEAFTGLKVEFYKEGNTQNFGEFRDGIIYLSRFVPKGTQWHEAFHGIFSLLPEAEQDRLLRIAGNKWGVTNEEFMELIKIYEDRGHANFLKSVGKDWIVKTILEEKIADHFQEFMVEGKKPVILESFFTKAKRFVNLMTGVVEEPSFQSFFADATKGKFKKNVPVGTQARIATAKYKVIPGSKTETESNRLIKELVNLYADRHNPKLLENFPELKDADNTLQGFVRYYINLLRKYSNEGIVRQATEYKQILEDPLVPDERKESVKRDYDDFLKSLQKPEDPNIPPTFVKEDGLVFPALFHSSNLKMITKEVIRTGNFKETYEEVDQENEKDIMHNESVQSKNPLTETSTRDLRNIISSMYYFDMGKPTFLDEKGVINNLLFNLSNVEPEQYEETLQKLAREGNNSIDKSDFSRSMQEVLNMYRGNETFKNIFKGAFDKRFVKSFQVVDTVNTRNSGSKVITVNMKNHLYAQMNLWRNQGFNKEINSEVVKDLKDIGKGLGINIEQDVYTDPNAQEVLNKLYKIIKGGLQNRDFNKVFSSEANRNVLESLAAFNIERRLDLGELNYKNADDKTQYSIINNSHLLEKITKIYLPELDTRKPEKRAAEGNLPNLTFGTFSGSQFGDNSHTYSDLDPVTYLYTTFSLYNNYYKKGDVDKEFTPYFFIQQWESKSTNFVFQGYNHAADPIENILKYLNEEVDRQAIRINETLESLKKDEDIKLIDGYHILKDPNNKLSPREYTLSLVERFMKDDITRDQLPRGFQYTNLPYANEKIISQNPVTLEDLEKMLSKQAENMDKYFREFNINKMSFLKETTNDNNLTEEQANKYMRNFLLNQYMNRSRVLAQITPNLAEFKGYVDITKRGAGVLASGPNHGEGNFKFGVIKDIDIEGANSTDAAGYESISERINRLLRRGVISNTDMSTGGVSDKKYENYLLLKAHLEDDRDYIDLHDDDDALLKIEKTVGYGEEYYIKTAVAPITRYMSSQFANKGDKITVNGVEYTAVKDVVNEKYYLPLPSSVDSWKMLNEMQQENGPQAIFAESAIKKNVNSKVDVQTESFAGKTLDFRYKDYRLQQENPSGKEKIKDGTQLLQLIDAYFSKDFGGDVSKQMDALVSELKSYGFEFFGRELVANINGETYDPFMEYVQAAMEGSALSDRIMEFFEKDPVTGTMKISSNMPMIRNKFEQYVMSYYNNNIASHKVPGNKCTLLTSLTKGVITFGDKTISTYEYNNLSKEDKNKCSTRRLSWATESKPYAEVIVSEEYINQMGFTISEWHDLKKNDPTLFEKVSTAVGYRIPTQAQHSMIPIKIVDILPASYGSTIIAPAEITKISGADYDVDSLYIHKPSVYHTVENKVKKFKMYEDDVYSYEKSINSNKIVKEIASKLNSEEKESIQHQMMILKRKKYSISKKLNDLRSISDTIKESSPAERDKYYAEKDSLLTEIKAVNNDLAFQKEEMNDVNRRSSTEAIKLIRDKDDPQRQIFLPGYVQGLKNPDGTKSVNAIIPESNFNKLLELRLKLLTSKEGVDLINTPAKDFMKEIYSGNEKENKTAYFLDAGYPNPNKEAKDYVVYSGQDTMLNEYKKISTGSKAIGGAANINKVAAFLQKNGVVLDSTLAAKLKSLYSGLEFDSASEFESDFDFIMQDGKIGFVTKTENALKFNTLSNMVSITVDNAKDQTLVLFNITDKNISEISTMAMLGMGINRISAILQTPAARKISSLLSIPDKGVYEYQEFRDNPKAIKKYIEEDLQKKGLEIVSLTDADIVDSISTWDENKRIEELLYAKDISNISDKDKHRLNVQYTIANLYLEISNITKDAYQVNTLLNFNKTIGKEGFEISKLSTAYNNISKDGFSFAPSNITSNGFINTVNDISGKLATRVGNKIIAYNNNTNSLTTSIVRSTDKEGDDYLSKRFQASLNKSFIDFLAINMFFNKHKEKNVLGGIDLWDENILNGTAITEAYDKVKNKLDSYTIGKMFEIQNPTIKYPFKRVGIDTFTNLSPDEEQNIVDSFDRMISSSDSEIKNFAYQVLAHVAVHDNYRYLKGSVVSKIRARYLGTYNQMYTEYLEPIIKEIEDSVLTEQEKRDLQYLKERGISVKEPKTVRQKLVYHTGYNNYTTLIGNFAKYFFSDNRNARFVNNLKGVKFLYKPQEGETLEITPVSKIINNEDVYIIEADSSINAYDIISPLMFQSKGIYIKESYENDVDSFLKEGVKVSRIIYKKLDVINGGYLPSVMAQQYPYNQYKEIVDKAIKALKEDTRPGTGANYGAIDSEESENVKGAFDYDPVRMDDFPDVDLDSGDEEGKENNAISNPPVQPNVVPVISAEETFNKPDETADALLKAQQDELERRKEEFLKSLNLSSFNPSDLPKMKVRPQTNTLANEVIDEISNNFEQYKIALESVGINSVEELMELSDERKATLIQDICKG